MEVDAGDAIRLILQFLKENRLFNAMKALQEESQISLNAVDSLETFTSDVMNGRWDAVLQQTKALACSAAVMTDLYEHILVEMMEMEERDVALQLLRGARPLQHLKTSDPERFNRLDKLIKTNVLESSQLFAGISKSQRRAELAQKLQSEVAEVAPSRLLCLLGQAIQWQHVQGLVPPGADLDLFRGAPRAVAHDRHDRVVRKSAGKIKFAKSSAPQSIQFSRDGHMLTSGSKDGFVEVWDFDKCKLRKDLEYQAKDEFMMHDQGVTAQAFSPDGEMLATGSQDGVLKVWKISTGVCLRRFDHAHSRSIHSVAFSRDGTQLLTASFDQLIRVHGLKSGQMLKEFQGHESYVNMAAYLEDGGRVVSASCDGTVKIWDAKTTECLRTIDAPNSSVGQEVDVVCVRPVPSKQTKSTNLLVCTRSGVMHLMSMTGELVRSFKTDANNEAEVGNFVDCVVSPRTKYVYGATDTGYLLAFSLEDGSLEETTQIANGSSLGLVHHPHRNLLATFGNDGYVRMWKA
ncbi:hypothetical protein ATCC90586_007701 [Pythium insidiosum]|nr:hypothetical protein ATCC90586_007701 [Pythium insidiosum]